MSETPSIGWSDFALHHNRPGMGHCYFQGSNKELLDLVSRNWAERKPGAGRKDRESVVLVPLPPERVTSATVLVEEDLPLRVRFTRRSPGEEGYLRILAPPPCEPVRFAWAVLYSAGVLQENGGKRSGNFDWEVITILGSSRENEPMHPVTMARNYLKKPGGTFCDYSAQDFAEAIDYWSRRAALEEPDSGA
ncbi:MAG: DUF3228 family protein [Candidatus Krumholzibacteria bacterium]|jgi:hypothetical protein|nr:DUF3228 family protein [Candidatus Krumholzibacteria bacterium]MDP6797330.1 DUF3228 family protein [Candidatus Krumholzibacteria bacterium]MDP7021527.1 DUF3228 family protein [Candidatus Krumholzibacteria bacterium]